MTEKNYIDVIAQQFYGNRTCTKICEDEMDFFLKGILSPEQFPGEEKTVMRKVVRIPNAEYLVVVYDQHQEDEYVNAEFPVIYAREGKRYLKRWGEELKMHVSCEIPEIGFKIHTRCFACRMTSSGEFEAIQPEDYSIIKLFFVE